MRGPSAFYFSFLQVERLASLFGKMLWNLEGEDFHFQQAFHLSDPNTLGQIRRANWRDSRFSKTEWERWDRLPSHNNTEWIRSWFDLLLTNSEEELLEKSIGLKLLFLIIQRDQVTGKPFMSHQLRVAIKEIMEKKKENE